MTYFKSAPDAADLTNLDAIPAQIGQNTDLSELFDALSKREDAKGLQSETDATLARLRDDVRRRLDDEAQQAQAARQGLFSVGYERVTRRFGQMLRRA